MKRFFASAAAALVLSALFVLDGCSHKAPLIGISSCTDGYNINIGGNYPTAVLKAGGVPVVLPLVKDAATARRLLESVDGLLMTGGEDIDPAYYGEEILNESVEINGPRDTSDLLLIEAARALKKPIMGICRGHQLVNVAFGGSLYQDIPTQIGTEHRQEVPGVPTHNIGLAEGSRLRALLGDVDSVGVNTHHHQSVKAVAPGFVVSARAADGVVEGIEGPGVFCVQFHPEGLMAGGYNSFLPIFEAFVSDCR